MSLRKSIGPVFLAVIAISALVAKLTLADPETAGRFVDNAPIILVTLTITFLMGVLFQTPKKGRIHLFGKSKKNNFDPQ